MDSTQLENRRLVICCDGTGNEIKENQSNVLKFYRCLKKDVTDQISYYDTGVGTLSDSDRWSVLKSKAKGVFGLATGYGLDGNVLDAYRFLVDHHRDGDKIFLFGFSRGAYTIRVLAGMLGLVGILNSNQRHLAEYAYAAYKKSSSGVGDFGEGQSRFEIAWRVQEVLETKRSTVKFMGCWDTVSSVITPRFDRLQFLSLEQLPRTTENPCVEYFRHALAIDERRRMFRPLHWKEPQLFKSNPFVSDEDASPQDIQQLWFAGVHSDIGGGYAENSSGAAKYPLAWMIDEARDVGLLFREVMVKRLVYGKTPANVKPGSKRDYAAPSPSAPLHDSMTLPWRTLEYIPKLKKFHDHPQVKVMGGFYIPKAESRFIERNASFHDSVRERIACEPAYRPNNLPKEFVQS